MKKTYRNILVVRTDRIGDVILTTPAIKALKESFPAARVTVLVSPLTQDLVRGNPFVDEVMVDDRSGVHKGLMGYRRLVRAVKERRFDLAVIFHTKRRTNLLCFLAGIPQRLGYRDKKFGFLLTAPVADERFKGTKHEAQYCLDLLRCIGINNSALGMVLPFEPAAEQWAEGFFREHYLDPDRKVIAVNAGASDATKQWPPHRFAELITGMVEKYACPIVLIGTANDKSAVQKILALVKTPVCDLTGQTSVAQLASLLKRCRLLVSNDSGPVHVAAAAGTPVVSIFTRNQPGINPERWKPLGPSHRVVFPPLDNSVSFASGKVAKADYLENIGTEEVLEAVDGIFKVC